MTDCRTVSGVELHLAHPDELPFQWIGREELLTQVLAAWLVLEESDLPLNPRLIGRPGVGKTTLAYAAGVRLGKPVYLFQATMDTRPEDLIITPVISEAGRIKYVASPVVSAMITGGVCVLDEGNRNEREILGRTGPPVGRPTLRGVDRGRDQDQGPPRVPLLRPP